MSWQDSADCVARAARRAWLPLVLLSSIGSFARAEDAEEAEYQKRWKSGANAVARLQRFAAKWCAENGLEGAATNEWEESLLLEPDNEDARKALGFTRKKGEWLRSEDFVPERENRGERKAVETALDTYRKKRTGIVAAAARDLVPLAHWAEDVGYRERAKRSGPSCASSTPTTPTPVKRSAGKRPAGAGTPRPRPLHERRRWRFSRTGTAARR